MAEMNKAVFSKDIRVVVMADWDASAVAESGSNYPKGTEWYQVMGSDAELKPYKTEAEKNLDDPAVLRAAVKDVFSKHKADRYGVVMWNHGGAWKGGFGHDGQDGTDDASKGMAAHEVVGAIQGGLADAGIKGDQPLDLLTFDTCLMAGVEIMAPFANLTKLFIANAEIDYGDGWDYTGVLELLSKQPAIALDKFAVAENGIWEKQHLGSGKLDDKLIRAHASFDMSHWGGFMGAWAKLVATVNKSQSFEWELLGLSAFRALPEYSKTVDNPSEPTNLRDVGEVLGALVALSNDDAVAKAAKAVMDVTDKMVVDNSMGDLRKSQLGLHAHIGLAGQLDPADHAKYAKLAKDWQDATQWTSVLDTLIKKNDGVGPQITAAMLDTESPTKSKPPKIQFETADKDVAAVSILLGVHNPQNKSEIGLQGIVGMGLIDPDKYEMPWEGELIGIAKGTTDVVPCTIHPWMVGSKKGEFGVQIVAVQGEFTAGKEKSTGYVLFDADTGKSISALISHQGQVYTFSFATLAKMAGKDTATFSASTVVVDTKTGSEKIVTDGDPIDVTAAGMELALTDAPGADYTFFVQMTDVWGNDSTAFQTMTLKDSLQ